METIGYCRVSTDDQSIANQQMQIEEAGYNIAKWFTDEAVSGSVKASSRDGFSRLLAYAREGDTVVVAVDRLGRDTIDVLSTVKALQAKGVRVVSLREGFDLSTPIGEAMLGIMSTLAQLERSLIAERRKAGIERAKAEGVHMGRPVKASSKAVQTLISQGKTRLQIQEELGISKATYYRLAK
ncbi:TPA: recombinase family protein [Escherichia coli]|nr:recombinase family protein [Escherichia coli]EIY6514211.1 recombinase family protein [Escherichia coli]EKS1115811.1 recombinase family protein [Escherichia coli]HEB3612499.1 recombinase family protein [Escherichia coli]